MKRRPLPSGAKVRPKGATRPSATSSTSNCGPSPLAGTTATKHPDRSGSRSSTTPKLERSRRGPLTCGPRVRWVHNCPGQAGRLRCETQRLRVPEPGTPVRVRLRSPPPRPDGCPQRMTQQQQQRVETGSLVLLPGCGRGGHGERAALGVPAYGPPVAGVDDRAAELEDALEGRGQVGDGEVGQGGGVAGPGSTLVDSEAQTVGVGLPSGSGRGVPWRQGDAEDSVPEPAGAIGIVGRKLDQGGGHGRSMARRTYLSCARSGAVSWVALRRPLRTTSHCTA